MPMISAFIERLLDELARDELILPSLPEVALKIREALEDPEAGINDLVPIISNDVALTAKLIRVANCALFRAVRPVETLTQALSRLGLAVTQNIATGFVMEQMFMATNDTIDRYFHQIWHQSIELASFSFVIAKYFSKLSPDTAMVAGLTSQIGMLPILTHIEDIIEPTEEFETLDKLLHTYHPKIGHAILKAWDFPEELQSVPLCFSPEQPHSQLCYADIVRLAALACFQKTQHPLYQSNTDEFICFKLIKMDAETFYARLQDYQDDIEQIRGLYSKD